MKKAASGLIPMQLQNLEVPSRIELLYTVLQTVA